MENLRNQRTVGLVTSDVKLKKLAAQPSLKQFKIFHENLVAVERGKVKLTLNRPTFLESFLKLSRTLRYDLHYNYIKRKYLDLSLLFTDTDSLTYQIRTVNLYEDFYTGKQLLGTRKKVHSIMTKTRE